MEVSKEELEQQEEDGAVQHAEADTGKSTNLYTSAAAVLPTAPQLSNPELQVNLTELGSHHIHTIFSLNIARDKEQEYTLKESDVGQPHSDD